MGISQDLDIENSLFLIIDLQSKLAPAIYNYDALLTCTLQLSRASVLLGIPALITEQYTKGLGETDSQIKKCLPNADYFEKMYFSACQEKGFLAQLKGYKRSQIIVVGAEAHVCVLQTCLDLLKQNFNVIIASDAVGARDTNNKAIAIEQLRQAGATISSIEAIIFQWTKKAGTSIFKEILKIIK